MCNLCKSSADLVLTSCSDQRNELISASVIVYVYYVKYVLFVNKICIQIQCCWSFYCELSNSGVINRKLPSAITGGT